MEIQDRLWKMNFATGGTWASVTGPTRPYTGASILSMVSIRPARVTSVAQPDSGSLLKEVSDSLLYLYQEIMTFV